MPDARTIWLFREKLTRAEAIKPLFDRFDAALRASGYTAMSGQIVDATLVSAAQQCMTDEERKTVKAGRIAEDWRKRPAKLRHKDPDAHLTVKFKKANEKPDGTKPPVDIAIPTYGYQNHVSINANFGFIRRCRALRRRRAAQGIARQDQPAGKVWADTAYRSWENEKFMDDNGFVSCVHRKKPKDKPINETTLRSNNLKSKVRSHVEHAFAEKKIRMGLFIPTIGIARAMPRSDSLICLERRVVA